MNRTYERINSIRIALSNNYISEGEIRKNITASFGLGFYPYDGDTLMAIINCADKFLYKAKHAGKNKVMSSHFFVNRIEGKMFLCLFILLSILL